MSWYFAHGLSHPGLDFSRRCADNGRADDLLDLVEPVLWEALDDAEECEREDDFTVLLEDRLDLRLRKALREKGERVEADQDGLRGGAGKCG